MYNTLEQEILLSKMVGAYYTFVKFFKKNSCK